MYYLYILHSAKSDRYYVGITEHPFRRLWEHNHSERDTYTSKHRPWMLEAVFECNNTLGEARKMENIVKKAKSRKLIQQLLRPDCKPAGKLDTLVRVRTDELPEFIPD